MSHGEHPPRRTRLACRVRDGLEACTSSPALVASPCAEHVYWPLEPAESLTVNCTPAGGSKFPVGSTTVDCTVSSDWPGESGATSATVTVKDAQPSTAEEPTGTGDGPVPVAEIPSPDPVKNGPAVTSVDRANAASQLPDTGTSIAWWTLLAGLSAVIAGVVTIGRRRS